MLRPTSCLWFALMFLTHFDSQTARAEEDARAVTAWLKSKGARMETSLFGAVLTLTLDTEPGSEMKWSDADLARLKPLKTLRTLNLEPGTITADGLAKLADLPGLTELVLFSSTDGRTHFTDEHLKGINKIKGLRTLSIVHGKITTIEPLAVMTDLEALRLPGADLQDAGFKHITGLKNLKSIYVTDGKLTDLAPLAGLAKLESVQVSGSPITDAGLAPIASLKNLKRLELQDAKITDASLVAVGGLSELTTLNLSITTVSDLKPLAGLTKLMSLYLAQTKINDDALKHLAGMTAMKYIALNHTDISDIAVLREMTKLNCVYINMTKIDDADLENLTGLKKNEPGEIMVSQGTKVTKAAADRLRKLYPQKYIE